MRVLSSVLSLLFISELVLAGPLGLPDSARPGAVRPQPEVMPEPSVEPSEDMVDIPAVIDRPFDIEEDPYVVVEEFRLLNAEDLPKYGVNIEEIQTTILDKLKADQPEQGEVDVTMQVVVSDVSEKELCTATVHGQLKDSKLVTSPAG